MKRFTRYGLVGLLFCAFAAAASLVVIDARKAPYNSLANVRNTTVQSEYEIRVAGLFQAAGTYRLLHGSLTLPAKSTFKMIWPDGSSEAASVVSVGSTVGVQPIPLTQIVAGESDGSSGGYVLGGGGNMFEQCSTFTIKSCATSSSGTMCRYDSYLDCSMMI